MNPSPLDTPREEAVEVQLWRNHSNWNVFGNTLKKSEISRKVPKEMGSSKNEVSSTKRDGKRIVFSCFFFF